MATSGLDDYREQADRFLTELSEEHYLHFAGLQPGLAIEPIYERHIDLFSLDACRELRQEAAGTGTRSREVELWRFACEGYLGRLTAAQEEQLAVWEAELEAVADDERIGLRMIGPRLANEPDRARRLRIEEARVALAEELNPLREEAADLSADGARSLGAASYRELYEQLGTPLASLTEDCVRFLDDTEQVYAEAFDDLLRARLGLPLDEVERADIPRLVRAEQWDRSFPGDRMLPALETTLAELGIDLRAQRNVELDLEDRPTKTPRAFCAPIEVPRRVVLVLKPVGGLDDWQALFHEAGHAEHFAHTSAHLSFEARRLGDDAVTESFAFLLEHLVTSPAWLARRLDFARGDELGRESATMLLYAVRRHCAKLAYEFELHGGTPLAGMRERYRELLYEATKIDHPAADYLADVDPGFYAASYLRARALEALVVRHLREHWGRAWFADRRAGSLLRELWSEGQGLDADEIARELTGHRLELSAVTEGILEALST